MVLEGSHSTSAIMEGDSIPRGYITKIQSLEVDSENGVADISGFLGGVHWSYFH